MKFRLPVRLQSAERSHTTLWIWPLIVSVVSLAAALLTSRIRPAPGTLLRSLWFGDYSSATSMLQAMATSVMTATALTFSLTVVALQLASQQFSPRVLREFSRDPVTKRVLVVLAMSFVFTTATLYSLRQDQRVPTVSVFLGFLLGIASLVAILGFITHIVRVIRVDTMMLVIQNETIAAIERFYPVYGEDGIRSPQELSLDDDVGLVVTCHKSGFVRLTAVDTLVSAARDQDGVIRIEVRAGDHIVRGAPIATVWPATPEPEAREALEAAVHQALEVGYERTLDQDAGFGIRQLEDIAVKAMSPAINDPVTAAHAVGHMADILVRLVGRRMGATLHTDEDGTGRAIVPDRDLRYYLDLACGQLRRFGQGEPTVLVALLRMLRDVAVACRDDHQREEVRMAAELVADQLTDGVLAHDAAQVHDLHRRVSRALDGNRHAAYADRVGETRSI